MPFIKHLTRTHKINPLTEILIIGTFNPDTKENPTDFFYGRSRNFLWKLLPTAFKQETLKGKTKAEKQQFINLYKIDFTDLIAEVDVTEAANYNDAYLDNKVVKWTNVIKQISSLPHLKKVCLTRKSFADIPNMKIKIKEISSYCADNNIPFHPLSTPSRFYGEAKQKEWNSFFNPED